MFRITPIVPALILLALLPGRERPTPTKTAAASNPAPAAALPSSLFLAAAPADAKDIKDTKAALKAGDKVVLIGRIGGSVEPFVAERAIFTLVDRRLKACREGNPEDTCETPWDFCCESRKDITANTATVQVVGTNGQPIKAELNGVHGLKPLATVAVVGTVAKAEGENIVVNASGLFVTP